ncbi:MAG: YfhO family protein [Anaerolineae bacterium]|nr:YfhO family protein [Anaerolineae bacterium]
MSRPATLGALWPVAVLIVSPLLLFSPLLLSGGLPFPPSSPYTDLLITHWPNAFFVRESLARYGQVPLWRPLIMSGGPFVGNPLSGLFYPPHWLWLILPLNLAFSLLFVGHVCLGGVNMYALARKGYGLRSFPALVAALTWAFTPKLIAHLGAGHVGLVEALAWLPLVILCTLRALSPPRSHGHALLAGAVLAVQFFADVRIAFYTAMVMGLYALCWAAGSWREVWPAVWNRGRALCLALVAFGGLAAMQIFPLLELMRYSGRGSLALAEAGRYSLPWRYLWGLFLADRGGFHEWMTYLGILPLLLASLALFARPRWRQTGFLVALALFATLFALGANAPLFPVLVRVLPGLSWLRVPARLWFVVAFAVALLAGHGVEVLSRPGALPGGQATRRVITLVAVGGIAFCLLLAGGFLAMYHTLPATLGGLAVFASGGLLLLIYSLRFGSVKTESDPMCPFDSLRRAACSVLRPLAHYAARTTVRQQIKGRMWLFRTLTLVLLVADLWWMDSSLFTVRSPEEAFAPGRDVAVYLAQATGPTSPPPRIYSPSYSLPQHLGALYDLHQVDGVDPTQLARYVAFMRLAGGYSERGYAVTIPPFPEGVDIATAYRGARPDAALLGLLDCRFVAAEFPIQQVAGLTLRRQLGTTYIYENERALPRAFVVHWVRAVADGDEKGALAALEELNPALEAVVEGGKELAGAAEPDQTQIVSYSPNHVTVETELATPGLLVISEIWYPGWRAWDNGREVPIYRTDYVLRGIYLEAGRHTVELNYDPVSLKAGGAISTLAWVGLGVALVWLRRRGR